MRRLALAAAAVAAVVALSGCDNAGGTTVCTTEGETVTCQHFPPIFDGPR